MPNAQVSVVGAVSIGSFELSPSVCGGCGEIYGISIRLCRLLTVFAASNRDEESGGPGLVSRCGGWDSRTRVRIRGQNWRLSIRGHGVFEHGCDRRSWKQVASSISQEESRLRLCGSGGIRPERKRSWLLVIRSTTSMGPLQTGQCSWAVISGSVAESSAPSRPRQRRSILPRLRLAKSTARRASGTPLHTRFSPTCNSDCTRICASAGVKV